MRVQIAAYSLIDKHRLVAELVREGCEVPGHGATIADDEPRHEAEHRAVDFAVLGDGERAGNASGLRQDVIRPRASVAPPSRINRLGDAANGQIPPDSAAKASQERESHRR